MLLVKSIHYSALFSFYQNLFFCGGNDFTLKKSAHLKRTTVSALKVYLFSYIFIYTFVSEKKRNLEPWLLNYGGK